MVVGIVMLESMLEVMVEVVMKVGLIREQASLLLAISAGRFIW
jgi:hypothetical protein